MSSENLCTKLIESIDGIVWEADATLKMTYVSPAAERLLGYPIERWLEADFWIQHVHPEDQTWVSDYCKQETQAGRSHDFEYRMLTSEGKTLWLRDIVTVVDEGGIKQLRGLMINITEAKKIEQERREYVRWLESMDRISKTIQGYADEEPMLEKVLEIVLDIFPCHRAWLFTPCAPDASHWRVPFEVVKPGYPGAFAARTEFPIDDASRQLMDHLLRSEDPQICDRDTLPSLPSIVTEKFGVQSQLCTAVKPKVGIPCIFGLHQCEPGGKWSQSDVKLLKQIGQRVADALTAKNMNQMLRDSEFRFRTFFDHAIDAMFVHDEDGRVIDVNNQACRNLGYSKDEIIGKYPDLFDRDFRKEKPIPTNAVFDPDDLIHFETRHRRRDGTFFPVEIWIKTVRLSDKNLGISISKDLTERSKLEEQFRQSQKMEAVGRLAGGLAHDFNNLLTVIGGYCELILDDANMDPENRDHVLEIRKAHARAATLTQQLLAFSRRKLLQPQVVDVNRRMSELQSLLSRLIGEDIKLSIRLEANSACAMIDPGQLEQAIVNLVVNSRDAMPEGGQIEIVTKNTRLLTKSTLDPSQDNDCIEISVKDNGVGMDQEVRRRIFEPFFTTKQPGKGTGLGLSMVYGFIQQSEGHIDVDSAPSMGTTVRIFLPVVDQVSMPPVAEPKTSTHDRGNETVLLVEDEPSVRDLAALTLRNHGYHVIEAKDGLEGLSAAREHQGKIDLLLSDLVMPHMNGWKLAEQLLLIRPDVRILFMSGYPDQGVAPKQSTVTDFSFCPKPFELNELLEKVREALNGVPQSP